MSDGKNFVLKSLGHGVYIVSDATRAEAEFVGGQIGRVLEIYEDAESGSQVMVLDAGLPTSKYEAAVVSDPEVSGPVRRAAVSSPADSVLWSRLDLVDSFCRTLNGEKNGPFRT